MQFFKNITTLGFVFIAMLPVFGCSTAATDSASGQAETPKAVEAQVLELYEVHHDGRIHVFYDKTLHDDFLALGETPFRLTRIGAGPKGETIVFGLTKQDKKMKTNIPAVDLYDGKLEQDAVYAEMRKHDRIYVFNSFKDMAQVRDFGHPNYMYTQIGGGPKGETVVYVLNKANKKQRPDALIAAFEQHNAK